MEWLTVIFVCALIGYFVVHKLIELSKEKELKKKVGWIITNDSYTRQFPLWVYVSDAQIRLKMSKQYCISSDDEWQMAKEILNEFKQDMVLKFFKGHLYVPKSKYVITEEKYFMFALCDFLEEHQCDYYFLGHKMHDKTLSYEEYGSWGGTLYDATYAISDFAVVYHKLLYVAYIVCKNSEVLNPQGKYYNADNSIKATLDTKQIGISRH